VIRLAVWRRASKSGQEGVGSCLRWEETVPDMWMVFEEAWGHRPERRTWIVEAGRFAMRSLGAKISADQQ